MTFLHERVFDRVLASADASADLRQGVRYAIMRLEERDAAAIVGTDPSIAFAARMRRGGFARFEEAIDEFRVCFNDDFLQRLPPKLGLPGGAFASTTDPCHNRAWQKAGRSGP
jgi:hypothetical protein